MSYKPYSVHLEQTSEKTITVRTPDGQTWTVPIDAVYGKPKAGQELRVMIVSPGAEDIGQTAFATAVLNELLKPSA